MPEGDAVWRTARRLAVLSGHDLELADLRWAKLATVNLVGRHVLETVPVGKHLLTRFAASDTRPAVTLHSHLRMDGSWRVRPRAGARVPGARSTVRAILATAEHLAIGDRLGMLDLVATAHEHRLIGHLGPDILGPGWSAPEALRRLLERPERPIGEALLDQRNLAGLGTIHASETLHTNGVSPFTPTGQVKNLDELIAELPTRLHDAAIGREWPVGAYRRPACRRCGGTIRRSEVGSGVTARVLHHCPTCQPG